VRPPIGARETGRSAAQILELGVACRVTIVRSQPLGMRDQSGVDLYGLVLTVCSPGQTPYQVQVSDQVSVAAIALLGPGNTVPAKRMPDGDDREVAIDWAAALTESRDPPA
jgi:hypothetical protein